MVSEDAEALPGREERTAGIAPTALADGTGTGTGTGTPVSLSPFSAPHLRNDSAFASSALLACKLTKHLSICI